MLRVLLAAYHVCMLCVGVSPKGEHQYTFIVIWMNYMYDMCFMSQNTYVNFIMKNFIMKRKSIMKLRKDLTDSA